MLENWLSIKDLKLKLIYMASQDGFKSSVFHEKCDKKGKTITIIQSDNG